ncbi:MAG TPA: Calx-beta domain-containing protein, partial [Pyrinomonadaceae bacterium]|nr:Calx-beta domain-containing protein [Pyrinomonadaceae bacterium]
MYGPQPPSHLRVFNACWLSFMILMGQLAPVGAAPRRANLPATAINHKAIVAACVTNPVVTKIADTNDGVCDGDCSLREALGGVCDGSTIMFDTAGVFATPQTITLSLGELSVATNVTIDAPDAAAQHITVSGNNASRVFQIQTGQTATISDITIANGNVTGGNSAGGILNNGTLTLRSCTVSGNRAANAGGGISNNGANGTATLTIINSTISGNTAPSFGGGIFSSGFNGIATLNLINSTVSGNGAPSFGGGIYNSGGSGIANLNITNSTIAGNRASSQGGGIFNQGNGGSAVITLANTIISDNTALNAANGPDIINSVGTISGNHNIITTNTGYTISGSNNLNVDPLLEKDGLGNLVLKNNGGPTNTHLLLPNSPAIEAGNNALALDHNSMALTTDQRGAGFPRIADSADSDTTATVDIGAYELHPTIENITDKVTSEDTPFNFNFNIGDDTAALIASVTATSGNTTLVTDSNLVVTGSGGTRNLAITPELNANTSAFGTATITVTVTATNGQIAQDTFVLTVNAVNDAPTANGQSVNTNEETPLPITLTGSDVETSSASLTFNVTVQPTNGVLSGTGANRTYTPNANFNGADSFKFTVTEAGGGSSPALTSAEATVTITVSAVNDGPVNTVPGAQSVTENSTLTFSAGNGNQISIADVDAGAPGVQVTLSATNGTLTLSGTAGLAFSNGDGTADGNMTFTGTVASINTALNGLVFTPTSGFAGAASLQIVTNDLGNTGGGGLSDTDVVNITVNDGGALQFSSATYSVNENGGTAMITVNRTGGTAGTTTVQFATSNGTATAGSDYDTATGTLTFGPGVPTQTFSVPITIDHDNEPNETINLTLSNVTGSGSLGTPSAAILTIVDDDPGGELQFSSATYSSNENTALITVIRVGGFAGTTTVDYTTSNGTATAGSDYTTTSGTLTFSHGSTSQSFLIPISNDTSDEPNETVNLTLSNVSGTGSLGTPSTAVLTIIDDDPPSFSLDASTYTVDEDDLRVTVTVNREGDSNLPVQVDYATSDPSGLNPCNQVTGNASQRCDYATVAGTLRFAAFELSKVIHIPVVDDVYIEGAETFTLTLSDASGGTLGTPATATVTINDNDVG